MNRKQIIDIVKKRFKNVNTTYVEVVKRFEPERIHAFRVAVKKLRAFLRMVNKGMRHVGKVKLPKKIKKFYIAVGDIRTLQLQKAHIVSSLPDQNQNLPKNYFNELDMATESAVTHASEMSKNNKSFEKDGKKIIKKIDKRHAKVNTKDFFLSISDELLRLLANDRKDDESFHLYRKLAKDIMYAWPWIRRKEIKTLPIPFTNYNRIEFLSDLLGEFHDTAIDLKVLENQETKLKPGNEEGKILSEIQHEWVTKKENIGRKLHDSLAIEFVP